MTVENWRLFVKVAECIGADTDRGFGSPFPNCVRKNGIAIVYDQNEGRAYRTIPKPQCWLDNDFLVWLDVLRGKINPKGGL